MKRIWAMMVAATAILAGASSAQAQTRVSFTTGLDYSTGDYGTGSDTNITSIPLAVRVANGDWAVRLSTSYLQIDGNADVADIVDAGGGTGTTGGSVGTIVRDGTARGIGDTTLAVTKTFNNLGGVQGLYLDATGRVRFATGDEDKGLGVGATDYALAAELGRIRNGTGVYVNVARRFLGDRAGVNRVDGWQAIAGGSYRLNDTWTVGGSYYWRESSFDGGEQPSELSAYVTYKVSDEFRVTLNGGGGLSDASPDASVGLRFNWRPQLDR